jgi:carbonic anhydrase
MSSSVPTKAVDMQKYLKQSLETLFKSNRDWASSKRSTDPAFFDKLADGQAPDYLWVA